MKKLIAFFLVVILISFNNEKTYSLKLTEQEFQALWYVVQQSNAPHLQVEAVKEFLSKQYNSQADTTKKK